jgi:hypothetical protein
MSVRVTIEFLADRLVYKRFELLSLSYQLRLKCAAD